jgi:hypothetical protein
MAINILRDGTARHGKARQGTARLMSFYENKNIGNYNHTDRNEEELTC